MTPLRRAPAGASGHCCATTTGHMAPCGLIAGGAHPSSSAPAARRSSRHSAATFGRRPPCSAPAGRAQYVGHTYVAGAWLEQRRTAAGEVRGGAGHGRRLYSARRYWCRFSKECMWRHRALGACQSSCKRAMQFMTHAHILQVLPRARMQPVSPARTCLRSVLPSAASRRFRSWISGRSVFCFSAIATFSTSSSRRTTSASPSFFACACLGLGSHGNGHSTRPALLGCKWARTHCRVAARGQSV